MVEAGAAVDASSAERCVYFESRFPQPERRWILMIQRLLRARYCWSFAFKARLFQLRINSALANLDSMSRKRLGLPYETKNEEPSLPYAGAKGSFCYSNAFFSVVYFQNRQILAPRARSLVDVIQDNRMLCSQ